MDAEATLRLGVFGGVLAVMAVAEVVAPRRPNVERRRRWPINLGIVALDTALARLLLPGIAVGAAAWAGGRGVGLFNVVDVPSWVPIVVSMLLFDLAIYGQHVVFHKVPLLWRLHRVHHTDLAFDVTTGVRFHPFEILISLIYKAALAIALGAPPEAVVLFEVVLSAASLFNHGNVRLPGGLDAVLRLLIVTPDMHRVHHSAIRDETDSNFGFSISVWDRLFGTYRAKPAKGIDGMTIGLEDFKDPARLGFGQLLVLPYGAAKGD